MNGKMKLLQIRGQSFGWCSYHQHIARPVHTCRDWRAVPLRSPLLGKHCDNCVFWTPKIPGMQAPDTEER